MSDLQCAARLLLVRHGEAEYETEGLSDAGGSLSLTGRKQARELADTLADARVSMIYCSGLARAVQTAEIIAARLGAVVRVRDNLREWSVGEYAGQPYVEGMYDDVLGAWGAGDHDARIPGGESSNEIRDRIAAELEAIVDLHRGETVLVVTHGGAIRVAVPQLAANVPDSYGTTHEVDHCAVIEADADADGWVLRSWGGVPIGSGSG
ncbi:MAG TPA: histidine phosphatase family protein [Nocardioidaceae bacterium]|nr:histidine phosphatase family protein [Nocardioidaceae bacterium]